MKPAGPKGLKDKIQGIYIIVDNTARPDRDHMEIAEAALSGGAKIIQLRAKNLGKRKLYERALKIRELAKEHGSLFIVNDHLDVAIAAGADGAHLGQEDLPISAARGIAGERLIIGISTHSIQQALDADKAGADYIGFGAMYSTTSKDNPTEPQGPARLKEVVRAVSIPVVAIGGICRERVTETARTGTAGFAVISAVSTAEDMRGEVEELIRLWKGESRG